MEVTLGVSTAQKKMENKKNKKKDNNGDHGKCEKKPSQPAHTIPFMDMHNAKRLIKWTEKK